MESSYGDDWPDPPSIQEQLVEVISALRVAQGQIDDPDLNVLLLDLSNVLQLAHDRDDSHRKSVVESVCLLECKISDRMVEESIRNTIISKAFLMCDELYFGPGPTTLLNALICAKSGNWSFFNENQRRFSDRFPEIVAEVNSRSDSNIIEQAIVRCSEYYRYRRRNR